MATPLPSIDMITHCQLSPDASMNVHSQDTLNDICQKPILFPHLGLPLRGISVQPLFGITLLSPYEGQPFKPFGIPIWRAFPPIYSWFLCFAFSGQCVPNWTQPFLNPFTRHRPTLRTNFALFVIHFAHSCCLAAIPELISEIARMIHCLFPWSLGLCSTNSSHNSVSTHKSLPSCQALPLTPIQPYDNWMRPLPITMLHRHQLLGYLSISCPLSAVDILQGILFGSLYPFSGVQQTSELLWHGQHKMVGPDLHHTPRCFTPATSKDGRLGYCSPWMKVKRRGTCCCHNHQPWTIAQYQRLFCRFQKSRGSFSPILFDKYHHTSLKTLSAVRRVLGLLLLSS